MSAFVLLLVEIVVQLLAIGLAFRARPAPAVESPLLPVHLTWPS
jgi:hypothetical protein